MREETEGILPDPETICAHWGEDRTRYMGAVIPPIFQNSLFTNPTVEDRYEHRDPGSYDYTRMENPTTEITEAKIAALEGGERARCFGSGMGAISAAILSAVKTGDHVVAVETSYGPTRQFLKDYLQKFQVEVTFVQGNDPADFEQARRPNTTLFYLESPSSLLFHQQDLEAVAGIAKANGITTICDNSWASPIFQNPIRHGIDMVVHSATKYLGGHSDIVAGVAIGSHAKMNALIQNEGHLIGAILDPFAAWLLMRGLRTLPVRMAQHQKTTTELVQRLLAHPKVEGAFYPGGAWDRQPELTQRQLRGTSGLVTVRLKPQTKEASYAFVNSLQYFGIGCSWGGFESLALPMHLPGHWIDASEKSSVWVIRMHIGLESVEDLWRDIECALARI